MKKLFPGISRRKKRQQERRDSIIEAAIQTLRKNGYEQTTMQEIAEAADLSASSVYYYFDSKLAIFDEALNVLIKKAKESEDGLPLSEKINQDLMTFFIKRLNGFGDLNLVGLLAEVDRNPELLPRVQQLFQYLKLELHDRIVIQQKNGRLKEGDPDKMTEMILSMGMGTLAISNIRTTENKSFIEVDKTLSTFTGLISNT
jgi:AcrR family transcriptional regulator